MAAKRATSQIAVDCEVAVKLRRAGGADQVGLAGPSDIAGARRRLQVAQLCQAEAALVADAAKLRLKVALRRARDSVLVARLPHPVAA